MSDYYEIPIVDVRLLRILASDKKDKYTSFKYEKIKIGEFSYICMENLF